MTPDQLRELAEALDEITPVMGLEELHHMETLDRAADYLRACAEQQPVAWSDGLGSFIEADEKVGDDPDILAYRVPLYAAPAAPQEK